MPRCLAGSDPAALDEAAAALRSGGLVAFPTETVYGLGGDAGNDLAVARIFEAKGRPRFNPLIVHVADAPAAARLGRWTERAATLAGRFWPGPLTLVLERAPDAPLSHLVSAGGATVGLRVPAHPLARALLARARVPVAGPSANRAGRISPTRAEHVASGLGDLVDVVLDGGPCTVGVESTVVDLTGDRPRLLRPGGLSRAALEAVLGRLEDPGAPPVGGEVLRSPGQLSSHYAPGHPVRLDACSVMADEALLAFGPDPPAGGCRTLNLSPSADLREAAANLFAMLHDLDRTPCRQIAVMPVPAGGLGDAIRDRLRRAAAPRPATA